MMPGCKPLAPVFPSGQSDAHGHDDVTIAVGFIGERAHLPGALLILQFDADGAIGSGTEKVKDVAGVETDSDWLAFVFFFNTFLRFAVLRAGSRDFHSFLGDGKFHSVRALIGKLGNTADSVA